jgi:hypothetical protein
MNALHIFKPDLTENIKHFGKQLSQKYGTLERNLGTLSIES